MPGNTDDETDAGPTEPERGTGPVGGAAAGARPPGRRARLVRGVAVGSAVLAVAVLLAALLLPDRPDRLGPAAFVRLPAEGILLAAVLLVVPPRARRAGAAATGVLIGLVTLVKCLDIGFYSVLYRPFDLVLDWGLLGNAADYVRDTSGRAGELAAVAGAVCLAVAVLVLTAGAALRLSTLLVRHRARSVRVVLLLGTAWITCVVFGLRTGAGPVASTLDAGLLGQRATQVRASLADARLFRREAAHDAFAHTSPGRLLTALRGKDVLFTFVESYGRSAIEDPEMGPRIQKVLQESGDTLKAAGFRARSGWLRSPVTGGGSWLAHSTFLSGLWISNQQRFRTLTSSDRTTLTGAFRSTGAWRTVGVVPGVLVAWPEGRFFGLDHVYDGHHLDYRGPDFGWSQVPDQFALQTFQRREFGKPGRGPLMAEIILTSSHYPWAPVPRMVDWAKLGDGSVFQRIRSEGRTQDEVWQTPESVRTAYRDSVAYSLNSLVGFLRRYGNRNTVLVFLGDHQPVPAVTGNSPRKDVPVTLVARDPKVLDRISGWGWTEGLKPAPDAPVWAMDRFRDRFLKAFGPRP
ncbi:sulfatase [Streptomyces sp. NBC_00557]|uniref:sulfatase n=1 Tax=Streptomyces sp. NBC_00557 TaxID=2975776 RepID=UPI002E7FF6E4|nr:sulfatase [Streptomyces sp. NBC_00557]WUC38725.1 sulfatase [Streptomyces sp. NBC_00557]